jgi:hypothetical protein
MKVSVWWLVPTAIVTALFVKWPDETLEAADNLGKVWLALERQKTQKENGG